MLMAFIYTSIGHFLPNRDPNPNPLTHQQTLLPRGYAEGGVGHADQPRTSHAKGTGMTNPNPNSNPNPNTNINPNPNS